MDGMEHIGGVFEMDMSLFTPEREAAVLEYERREAERSARERYRNAVPERYWRESLDTFATDTEERGRMADAARQFAREVKCGAFRTLVLLGAAGTGKTHLACGILRECGGLYRMSPAIAEEFRREKSFKARKYEAGLLDLYGRSSLLVVDEIGRGIAAQEERYMLYQIINERYNRRKPTVLISNQGKKDFLDYLGVAAVDRLTESARIMEFAGNSYRAVKRCEGLESALDSAGV